jgi:hypothetical protein
MKRQKKKIEGMELLGLVLSIPAGLIGSLCYCFFLSRVVTPREGLRRAMWLVSCGVLAGFAAETVLLSTVGATATSALLGYTFYLGHLIIVCLGTPALANFLLLRKEPTRAVAWYAPVPLCTLFAVVLVSLQYGVREALFGIE